MEGKGERAGLHFADRNSVGGMIIFAEKGTIGSEFTGLEATGIWIGKVRVSE